MGIEKTKIRLSTKSTTGCNESEPFVDDALKRKNLAIQLTHLLGRIDGPCTLSISAGYGSGKTHFVSRWKQMLENEGYATLLINAWESDYTENPLLTLLAGLEKQAEDKCDVGKIKKAMTSIKDSAKTFMRISGSIAIAHLTRGAISTIADIDSAKAAGEIAAKFVDENYKSHIKIAESINKFKIGLTEYAKELSPTNPLIVFIDELDRCAPSYAIEFLESIKHLFSVDSVVYVLAIDRQQIKAVVKSHYGEEIDTDGYLRRFIDLNIHLPKPSIHDYCISLIKKYNIGAEGENLFGDHVKDLFEHLLPELFEALEFSLRKINQCVLRLLVLSMMTNEPMWFYVSDALALAVVILEHDEDLYRRILDNERPLEAFQSLSRSAEYQKLFQSRYASQAAAYLSCLLDEERNHLVDDRIPFDNNAFKSAINKVIGHTHFTDDVGYYRGIFNRMIEYRVE